MIVRTAARSLFVRRGGSGVHSSAGMGGRGGAGRQHRRQWRWHWRERGHRRQGGRAAARALTTYQACEPAQRLGEFVISLNNEDPANRSPGSRAR